MTITPTAQPISLPVDCPVDWCRDAGSHAWRGDVDGAEPSRFHVRETATLPAHNGRRLTVTAEAFETDDGRCDQSVEFFDGDALYTREEVDQFIDGLLAAADMAFGPVPEDVPATPGRDDTAAALVELMDRALRPHDVNRLVAAAFRYRNACIAAGEIR